MEREERRRQIMNSARRVFARRGYHRSAVSDIIQEAQIARGTFYLYFDSKRELFDTLLDEFFEMINREVRRIDASRGQKDVLAQIRRNLEGTIGVLVDNRELTKILLSEAVGLDPDFDRKLLDFYGRLLRLIEGSLRLGMEMKLIRPCDTEVASWCMLGTLKEVMYQFIMSERREGEIPRKRIIDEVLYYNLQGLFIDHE